MEKQMKWKRGKIEEMEKMNDEEMEKTKRT